MTTEPVTAVIVVDHGSRRALSNETLLAAARRIAESGEYEIVEPAHMELADPDIATAFRRCVERGAERIVVFPYFLSPGRHWKQDIPELVEAAAASYPGVSWIVTRPFGLHDALLQVIHDRIAEALQAGPRGT